MDVKIEYYDDKWFHTLEAVFNFDKNSDMDLFEDELRQRRVTFLHGATFHYALKPHLFYITKRVVERLLQMDIRKQGYYHQGQKSRINVCYWQSSEVDPSHLDYLGSLPLDIDVNIHTTLSGFDSDLRMTEYVRQQQLFSSSVEDKLNEVFEKKSLIKNDHRDKVPRCHGHSAQTDG